MRVFFPHAPLNNVKLLLRKVLVDGATVILLLACLYSGVSGLGTLYASYYASQALPTPEVFSSSSQQFATSISIGFAIMLTRKYRVDGKQEEKK